ncbi:hypothetical protein NUU61_004088 [Penicillium alfredii]|uniref:Cell morphogenesis protein Las1 n=1 Tax=Penicillium alfredii TaxID=1506179 RepID=A0A9W9KDH4_9EURO|nr:uncharacterized protein NUU61_004088 [Penicillium alfredii]KAJ5101866.1 hypothetical protein NUU61_004088 [Penicillium alfredii]
MAKVIFTAWKSKAQLLDVRTEFYPSPSYDGPDLRSHACAMVEAWKLRGNVPHHVEATALLTDAILHDDAQTNSIFSIRATYSAAFCRFVTGLVDTKIPGQRKTMFQRAVDLGLPASFVELRHEATHREPPSLVVLRKAAQRSLEWLWDNYWADINDLGDMPSATRSHSHDDVDHDSTSLEAALCDLLRPFSTGKTSAEPVRKKRKRDQELALASQLVSICAAEKDAVRVLAGVLLGRSVVIPSDRKLGDSMNDTFDKWDPVLQTVTEDHPSFLRYLAEDLVNHLAFYNANHDKENPFSEALFLWLVHLLTSPAWKHHRHLCPSSYLLRVCKEQPQYWTKMLGNRLQEENDIANPASSIPSIALNQSSTGTTSDTAFASSDTLRAHGWGMLEKWDSRPLGIVSSR